MVGVFRQQALYPATATSHYPSKSTAGLQELVRGGQENVQSTTYARRTSLVSTGLREGIEQGLERGIERGRAEGCEQGREEGLEEGLKVGLVNLVRQGLLTPEVASEQLGMTVAEFESLL